MIIKCILAVGVILKKFLDPSEGGDRVSVLLLFSSEEKSALTPCSPSSPLQQLGNIV